MVDGGDDGGDGGDGGYGDVVGSLAGWSAPNLVFCFAQILHLRAQYLGQTEQKLLHSTFLSF